MWSWPPSLIPCGWTAPPIESGSIMNYSLDNFSYRNLQLSVHYFKNPLLLLFLINSDVNDLLVDIIKLTGMITWGPRPGPLDCKSIATNGGTGVTKASPKKRAQRVMKKEQPRRSAVGNYDETKKRGKHNKQLGAKWEKCRLRKKVPLTGSRTDHTL